MKLHAALQIGFRYLRGSGKSGIHSHLRSALLGITLSIIPLILVLEVSDGMIEGITRRFIELGTYHMQIIPRGETDSKTLERVYKQMEKTEGVSNVSWEHQGLGLAYSENDRTGSTIRAIEPDLYEKDKGFRKYMELTSGSFDLSLQDNVVIGSRLAEELDISVGESLKVLTVRSIGSSFLPRISTFTVTGVVSAGYKELDALWMFIPLEKGKRILRGNNQRSFIGTKVENPYDSMEKYRSRIRNIIPASWDIYTWFELERAQYKSFQTTRALLVFIMVLIFMVAAVNISSSIIMLVLEKRSEIAILKSMGASPSTIRTAFIFIGFLIGLIGSCLGMIIGLFLAVNINYVISFLEILINNVYILFQNIVSPMMNLSYEQVELLDPAYYLEKIPIKIVFHELTAVMLFALIFSSFAAYFPAQHAARTRPLDVMRKH